MTKSQIPTPHILPIAVAMILLAMPVLCPAQPQARLQLEVPNERIAQGESIQFNLTLTNTGAVSIPVLSESSFISTRQIFLVAEVLESRTDGRGHTLEPGRRLPRAEPSNPFYLGGVESADWMALSRLETIMLNPGIEISFSHRTLMLHDRPVSDFRALRFSWQFWWLIGDGSWAKSNEVQFELVDLNVAENGELVAMLDSEMSLLHNNPLYRYPLTRLVVDDEQWIFLQSTRVATLPADHSTRFYWDPPSSTLWLHVDGEPDRNVQLDVRHRFIPREEQTTPDPRLQVETAGLSGE